MDSSFSRSGRPPARLKCALLTEGPYLTLPTVALILTGVLVLAALSSLVFEFSGLPRRDVTVVFWLLLMAIWLGAVFVVGLLRPQGWWW